MPAVVANSICMELIEIPAGKFTMGSPTGEKGCEGDEGGCHGYVTLTAPWWLPFLPIVVRRRAQVAVTLTKPFLLGKTEVTQGQWKKVMGTEPWKGQVYVDRGANIAASYLDWDDATDFCDRLTVIETQAGKLKAGEEYRLPTEAEWEYACRAGTTTAYSFGDDKSQLGGFGWFSDLFGGGGNTASEQYAHEVGLKKPNPWGLYDMHGNVWEWCSDRYGETLSGGTDPVGPGVGSQRVFRGGGWQSSWHQCRSARRNLYHLFNRTCDIGFRVARSQSAQ